MLSLMLKGDDLNGVRFRPGCYFQLGRGSNASPAAAVNDFATVTAPTTGELATTPGLRGVQIRYGWAELEPTEGSYVFTELDSHLADILASRPNDPPLLSILIQCKTFVDTQHVVPSWMRNSTYGEGEHRYSETDGGAADGYIVAFNNAAVRAKFQLLANALGARYANNVQIELIGITEMNIPGIAVDGVGTVTAAMTGHLEGGITCLGYLQTAFPRTIVRQILNYPKSNIAALISTYAAAGIGIGAADIFQDEIQLEYTSGQGAGIYDHMRTYSGVTPIVAEFQNKNFIFSNLPRRINPANGWAASCTVSNANYTQVTGTITGALTVGNTITGATSGATATVTAILSTTQFLVSGITGTFVAETYNVGGSPYGTITSTAAYGATLLAGSIAHGLNNLDTTEYFNIDGTLDAILKVNSAGGGWTAGNLTIVSVPSANNIVVSHTYAGETAPTGLLEADSAAYPLTNQSYIPNARTYTGYVPTIAQLAGFAIREFSGLTHMIFTRLTSTSVLDGETHNLRVRKYINSNLCKYGKSGGCTTTRPTNIA